MSDLLDKAINRLARETAFKMEVSLMRDDYRAGTASAGTLNNQIWRLAQEYRLSPWLVRALVEERWR